MPTGLVYDCALLQKHVVKRLCVGVGGGIMAPFCSTNHPLPTPVLSKLGLRSRGMALLPVED